MSDLQKNSTERSDPHAWHEHRPRDPFARAMGGMVLILLGVVFFVAQNRMFGVTWANMWGAFLIGLGGLLILQALMRLAWSSRRRGVFGLVIGGMVLMVIGTMPFGGANWASWWPLGLIAVGVALLIQQFTGW